MSTDNTAEMPAAQSGAEHHWYHNRLRLAAGAAVLAVAGTVGGLWATSSSSSNPYRSRAALAAAAKDPQISGECDPSTIDISDISYPGQPDEILPSYSATKVDNDNEAASYSESLFSKKPLGEKIDPGAEATIYTFIGYPATSKSAVSEEQYPTIFSNVYASMTSGQSEKQSAADYCETDALAMGETVGYSSDAIAPGQTYTQITPELNSEGHISGLNVQEKTATTSAIAGVIYEAQNQPIGSKNLKGFDEVIVQSNGSVDVLGLKPEAISSNKNQNQGASSSPNKSTQSTVPSSSETQQSTSSSSSSSSSSETQPNQSSGGNSASGKANGNQSGNQGSGKKGITSGGKTNEGQPGTTKPTPAVPTKSKPTPKPAPKPTPKPKPTTPTTTPPETTTPPSTTTPTTTPPTTTTPTTTPPTTTTPTTIPPTTTTVPTKSGDGTPGNSGGSDPGTGGNGDPF